MCDFGLPAAVADVERQPPIPPFRCFLCIGYPVRSPIRRLIGHPGQPTQQMLLERWLRERRFGVPKRCVFNTWQGVGPLAAPIRGFEQRRMAAAHVRAIVASC